MPRAADKSIEETLETAVSLHRAGRLEKAERLYLALLQKENGHPDANHNLGVIKMQQGRATSALPYLSKALDAQPGNGLYWLDYIEALHLSGQHDEARKTFTDASSRGLGGPEADILARKLGISRALPAPPANEIDALLQSFNEGNLDLAISQARKLTSLYPQHAFGWKVLAASLQHTGKNDEALPAARQAVALAPDDAIAHHNIGIILSQIGQADKAVHHFQEALRYQPDNASTWYNLGVQQLGCEQPGEAEASFRQAIRHAPDYAEAHNNLGVTLRKLNRPDEAATSFLAAIDLARPYAEPHINLGTLLHETGQLIEAEKSCRNAIAINPDRAEIHNKLGLILLDLERYEEAKAAFRTTIQLQAGHSEATIQLATLQQAQGHDTLAEEILRNAVRMFPDNTDMAAHLGRFLIEQGKLQEAEEILDQALTSSPGNIKALTTALECIPYKKEDQRFSQLESLYACREMLSREDRINIDFAMGKAMMDIGENDRSFEAYDEGNKLHFEQHPYREAQDMEMLDKLGRIYTRELFTSYAAIGLRLPPDSGERIPVFIVGMPRSGSSLIEQVLASHPEVFGAGELPISHQFADPLKLLELLLPDSPDPEHRLGILRKIGRDYLDTLWKLAPDARCIVDKQLGNFCHIGLIHLMLPNAKIIHAQRDPMDTCFSCYTTRFSKGLFFTYDQATLARHHLFYQRVMAHWQATLPAGRILTLSYESHVQQPEQEARRILEHIGLPWNEACLRPHETLRTVKTASFVQVRRPIHTNSVARWRKFSRHLAPMLSILRPDENILPHPTRVPSADIEHLISAHHEKRHETAAEEAWRLSQTDAHHPLIWQILGASLLELNRPEEALAALENAVKLAPGDAGTHYNLAVALEALHQHDDAIAALKRSIELQPAKAAAHYNLATLLQMTGENTGAENHFTEALRLQPQHADANNNLGILLKQQGRFEEAIHCFEQAIHSRPEDAALHNNLGMTLHLAGHPEAARNTFRKSLQRHPEHLSTLLHLALTLMDTGELAEAETHLRHLLALDPDNAEALNHLGSLLDKTLRFDEATTSCQRALALKPKDAAIYLNLARLAHRRGEIEEAEQYSRHALESEPDNAAAHSAWLFCLSHQDTLSPEALYAEHLKFGERFEAPLKPLWQAHPNDKNPERTLRVGLVSGDLLNHVAAAYIQPMLASLSHRPGIELHIYDNQVARYSAHSLHTRFPHWHVIAGLPDDVLARRIRNDAIDILVDLSGHTPNNRLTCFAHRPAPIQASWIGYPGTTGLTGMDYFLADPFFLPPGECDHLFTEKIIYLPSTLPCLMDEQAPPVLPLPALIHGHLTFGSFNRPNKIHPRVVALWSALLRALPDSRMVLAAMTDEATQKRLLSWFVREGIAPKRLTLLQRTSKTEYLAQHHLIDICLDTFPYNGSATAGDALWMGVPTLTLAGKGIPGRAGAAWQRHLGLAAFVADTPEAFVNIGRDWSNRLDELSGIRNNLRDNIRHHKTSRADNLAVWLDRALRTAWKTWCDNLPAASYTASPATSNEPD